MNRAIAGLFLTGSLIVLSSRLALADEVGLDFPHNNLGTHTIGCLSCHYMVAETPPDWATHVPLKMDDTPYNVLCRSCHNNAIAPAMEPHSSRAVYEAVYGENSYPEGSYEGYHDDQTDAFGFQGWSVECRTCHWPHQQMQVQTYGTASYVYSGTVNALTDDSVTRTNAAWTVNQYIGYILIPNVNEISFQYKIESNTSDTLTVEGPIDLTKAAINNTFAIVYGSLVKSTLPTSFSGDKTVKLFDAQGASALADNSGGTDIDPTPNGVCQVCHTETKHWLQDGSLANHYDNYRCTSCHLHTRGFGASCDACHGNPPVVSNIQAIDGLVVTPSATGSNSAGAHSVHATESGYNFSCDTCHFNGMPTTAVSDNNKIQLGFSMVRGQLNKDGSGTIYDGRTSLTNPYTYESTNNTTVTNGGTLACKNTYCHSDGLSISWPGRSLTNTSTAWNWAGGAAGDPQGDTNKCNNCHPMMYSGTSIDDHQLHFSRGWSNCKVCHYSVTTNGTTITDKSKHINGIWDVSPAPTVTLGTSPPLTIDLTFDYVFAPGNGISGGNCNNNSCHVALGFGQTKTWLYTSIKTNGTFSYTTTDCGSGPNDPVTISATITPSGGAGPYQCKINWGDTPGLSTDAVPWGACSNNSHTYTGGRGLYTTNWSVKDSLGSIFTPPEPRVVNVSPCNQAPVMTDFTIAGGPIGLNLYDVVVYPNASDPDYSSGTHNGQGAIYITWGSGSSFTSSALNLTDTASTQGFPFTYSAGGYANITVYVKDNATADSRYQCWTARKCSSVFISRGMSETPSVQGTCTTPAKPADCLP